MRIRPLFIGPFRPFVLLLAGLLVIACQDDPNVAQPRTVADLIAEEPEFSILRAAIQRARFGDALRATNLTLFAPTDAAFQAAGYADAAAVTALPVETVQALLQYHVLTGVVTAADVPTGVRAVETGYRNVPAYINRSQETIFINGARVTQADTRAANGIVHRIDRPLSPPSTSVLNAATASGQGTLFALALVRASSADPSLSNILFNPDNTTPVTVFIPTDAAFRAAGFTETTINNANAQSLANTLRYHILSGVTFGNQLQPGSVATLLTNNRVTINRSGNTITVRGNRNSTPATLDNRLRDLVAPNSVAHVIDQVLQP